MSTQERAPSPLENGLELRLWAVKLSSELHQKIVRFDKGETIEVCDVVLADAKKIEAFIRGELDTDPRPTADPFTPDAGGEA